MTDRIKIMAGRLAALPAHQRRKVMKEDFHTLVQFSLTDLADIVAALDHHRQIYTMTPGTAETLLKLRRIERLLLYIKATANAVIIAAIKEANNELGSNSPQP